MSSSKKIAEFPDVEAKLQKPAKKSIFEKQKEEAEAKRQREAAETAAVYADFVKSFENDDDDDPRGGAGGGYGGRGPPRHHNGEPPARPGLGGQPALGGTGRRHFGIPSQAGMKSGPGSLGPPPMSLAKKRALESEGRRDKGEARGATGIDDRDARPAPLAQAFDASDDEDERGATDRAGEKAVAKPTLRLANLPPGTSPAAIKALTPSSLTVENVKISPLAGGTGTERKSVTAIVTLSQETAATDIDSAVSALQNRYLGFGFYLTLHRHLSSVAITSATLPSITSAASASQPFGAKPVPQAPGPQGHHRHHPPGRFAPPSHYGPAAGGPVSRNALLHVPIQPPRDIKQLRMIHKVVESVLEHGPEFEALLMSRPDVQREERWAWIWDARSQGGIWYRWRLWEIMTGSQSKRGKGRYLPLFENNHAWKVPDQPLAYEYTTGVDEFISESEYNSSDDDELDGEPRPAEGANEQEDTFLNPIDKARLVHLLARLPTTMARLRKGDVARVTAFAILHASRGADEVVDLIVSNIEKPFACTSANPAYRHAAKDRDGHDGDSRHSSPAPEEKTANGNPDTSGAKLLGLYVVSDILSSSSTSGVRHAWRYRQLFEAALKGRRVFEGLGATAERMSWGRLRAEKWKRSIGLVLNLWEGWCVFPADTHESFAKSFEEATMPKKDDKAGDAARKDGGRWKTVEAAAAAAAAGLRESAHPSSFRPVSAGAEAEAEAATNAPPEAAGADGDDDDDDDESYDEYTDDEQADDELLAEFDIDGETLLDIDIDGLTVEEEGDGDTEMGGAEAGEAAATGTTTGAPSGGRSEAKPVGGTEVGAPAPSAGTQSRKRMRAADMFADSDSGGEK